jgi:hypothetical protein
MEILFWSHDAVKQEIEGLGAIIEVRHHLVSDANAILIKYASICI